MPFEDRLAPLGGHPAPHEALTAPLSNPLRPSEVLLGPLRSSQIDVWRYPVSYRLLDIVLFGAEVLKILVVGR